MFRALWYRAQTMNIRKRLIGAVAPLLLLVSLAGCSDLFNPDKEDALLQKIDEQVRWDNAARLTVRVATGPNWWSSPQLGTGNAGDTRLGFPFKVEATQSPQFGFAGWKAFWNEDWNAHVNDPGDSLLALEITDPAIVTISGKETATVTINTTDGITLVPWSEERPSIASAKPPQINSGVSWPIGTPIEIIFRSKLDPATVQFGPGFIEIKGEFSPTNTAEPNYGEPYEDDATAALEAGDMTGTKEGTSRFFYSPVYDATYNKITIYPGDGGTDSKDGKTTTAQPMNVSITVTIGTRVLSENGNGMLNPAVIPYRIGDTVIIKQYYAQNVWGIHDDSGSTIEADFFYNANDSKDRERRLTQDGADFKVNLYFRTHVTDGGITSAPAEVRVTELHYMDLEGNPTYNDWPTTGAVLDRSSVVYSGASLVNIAGAATSAEQAYKNSNITGDVNRVDWIKVQHTMKQTGSGIYRLAVMPYHTGNSINPQAPSGAAYINVVIDRAAPGGTPILSFAPTGSSNGYASANTVTNPPLYVYGKKNTNLSFTADLSNIKDNAGDGIEAFGRTSADRPYTMDSPADVRWQWQITGGDGTTYPTDTDINTAIPAGDAAWREMNSNETLAIVVNDLKSKIGSSTTNGMLRLRYKDRKGNVSGWNDAARIKYYEDNLADISGYTAAVNSEGTAITVSWQNPGDSDFTGAALTYSVNYGLPQNVSVTNAGVKGSAVTATFSVPAIYKDGVQNGSPVSGINRYDCTLTVRSEADVYIHSFSVWNIPDMSVSNANPAIEVNSATGDTSETDGTISLANIALGNPNKNYVLTADITAGSWMPVGTGSGANAFQGKFYGNGHTVTITGFGSPSHSYQGLFGVVQGAEIRDLTVTYGAVTVTNGTTTSMGGIAGQATGTTKILNCIVKGEMVKDATGKPIPILTLTSSSTSDIFMGGMVGYMEGGVRISNCRAALNMSLTSTSETYWEEEGVFVGGVAGSITGGGAAEQEIIADVTVLGSVTLVKKEKGTAWAGGVAGRSTAVGRFARVVYDYGTVTAQRNFPANNNYLYVGGIFGQTGGIRYQTGATGLKDCEWGRNAALEVPTTNSAAEYEYLYAGGLVGIAGGIEAPDLSGIGITMEDSVARGDISIGAGGSTAVGGLAGRVQGLSEASRVVFTRCVYESGSITVISSVGLALGGCIGSVSSYMRATNSYSRAALLEVKESTRLHFGGFGGILNDSVVTDCGSSSPLFIGGSSLNDEVNIGGFVGYIQRNSNGSPAKLERCWATGNITAKGRSIIAGGLVGFSDNGQTDSINRIVQCYASGGVQVEVSGNGNLYAGGLVGYAKNTELSESWAAGAVSARSTGSNVGSTYAGGLVGTMSDGTSTSSSIANCYALGNVLADDAGGSILGYYVAAGGIVGYANMVSATVQDDATADGKIKLSFAKGTVSARSNGTVWVHAGGIAGRLSNGTVEFCAALCPSVTMQAGSTTKDLGRIYGTAGSANTGNYAVDTMRLENGGYDAIFFTYWDGINPTAPPANYWRYPADADAVVTGKDGASVSASAFTSQSIWTSSTYLDFNKVENLDKDNNSKWDFSSLVGRGYPLLAGTGGQ
ncbi:hypothetical protein AGMMS50293_25320 [Spirochaetia bacterium]|nr:hypothetical protein AGMMS50293_25320 [Spirochaetia bacterium]